MYRIRYTFLRKEFSAKTYSSYYQQIETKKNKYKF